MGRKRREAPQRLGAKLLAVRQYLGLSQVKLAKHLGYDSSTYHRISEYETGRREPSLIFLLRIARLAEVRVEFLIDDNLDLPL